VTRVHQTDFPAQQSQAQAAPWLPFAYGHQERPESADPAPGQRPQAPVRLGKSGPTRHLARAQPSDLNPSPIALERLRARREFLYVADGPSERRRYLVIQARNRLEFRPVAGAGFTATRKVGNSVIRNRARRRLREAVRILLPLLGVAGTDYVFIARQETGSAPWARLLDDMETALLTLRRRLAAEGPPAGPASTPPAKG
jgi:ribonuclease P protein component